MKSDGVVRKMGLLMMSFVGAMYYAQSTYAGPDIKNCSNKQTKEISQTIDWGAAHWKQFEALVEKKTTVAIKNCLEKRFKKNGRVVCHTKAKGFCKKNAGWSLPSIKKCHMCPAFLTTVTPLPKKVDRQACYYTLMVHEWSHTCGRTHKSIENIASLAFDFWKRKHPKTGLSSMAGCNMLEDVYKTGK